ncbi:MAG: NAD-dependent epimerase/dehydratase family protein [Candidatus Omnitrophica bacterium]|nr:NAD-dependent epimerase/dehydratase family protein [Candidatus Omnitrophota bacterium]
MNAKRILIIGGTGFIGGNLVRFLSEQGETVIVVHRKDSRLEHLQGLSYQAAEGDITDRLSIQHVVHHMAAENDIMINLASCDLPGKRYRTVREQVNVDGAALVASIARKKKMRLVHISSSMAVGFPDNGVIADEAFTFNGYDHHYAVTKYRGECSVMEEIHKGLDAVIAIPCSTVGPHGMKREQKQMFQGIKKNALWYYPPGGLCLTCSDDLVRGIMLCCTKGATGQRYILGGMNITYKEYLSEIAQCLHAAAPSIGIPSLVVHAYGRAMDVLAHCIHKDVGVSREIALLVVKKLYYSSECAIKELGYSITHWRETIRQTVGWLQTNNEL